MSYGAAAADDDVYNNDDKLFEKEHRKVIGKCGTTNLILH
jgi:hypothetical protein